MPSGRSRSKDVLLFSLILEGVIELHFGGLTDVGWCMWQKPMSVHDSESLLSCAKSTRLAGLYIDWIAEAECTFGKRTPCEKLSVRGERAEVVVAKHDADHALVSAQAPSSTASSSDSGPAPTAGANGANGENGAAALHGSGVVQMMVAGAAVVIGALVAA